MFTETHLYDALQAAGNTKLTTAEIMSKIAQAQLDGVFDGFDWGNMSSAQLQGLVTYFLVEYCEEG